MTYVQQYGRQVRMACYDSQINMAFRIDLLGKKKMSIYKQAVAKWGEESQIDMTIEECAELIVELRHVCRGRSSIGAVCSEVADVEIMCTQMRVIFGPTLIDKIKVQKLKRLQKLIMEVSE